jgi:thiamine-phosphate pyrophosphorylase
MLRCAITGLTHYGYSEEKREALLLKQAERLAEMGIDYLQLREKELSARQLIGLSRRLLAVLRATQGPSGGRTRLLVNSRVDVAAASGADGVHLPSGGEQLTPDQARRVLGRAGSGWDCGPALAGQNAPGNSAGGSAARSVVSVSCHTLAEVDQARAGGADFLLFGPVFGKSVAGRLAVPGTGLEALSSACKAAAGTPVLALGGVTVENAAECVAAGASGVAGIRLFL